MARALAKHPVMRLVWGLELCCSLATVKDLAIDLGLSPVKVKDWELAYASCVQNHRTLLSRHSPSPKRIVVRHQH